MWLDFVRVSPEAFKTIKATPELLQGIFFADEEGEEVTDAGAKLGVTDEHVAGMDYVLVAEALEEIAAAEQDDEKTATSEPSDDDDDEDEDEDDEEEDEVFKALGISGTVDFDAGYGDAAFLDPKAVQKAAKASQVPAFDDEVEALFKAAAKAGHYIIAVVS